MEKIKKNLLLIILIIIVLIIIIIGIILIKLKNENDNVIDEHENEYYSHGEEEKNTSLHTITDTSTFYTVENCINIYIDNIKIYNNQKESIAKKMWGVDINDNVSVYYVYTKIRDKNTLDISNEEDFYCTVVMDKYNNTFLVESNGKEYSEYDLNAILRYSTTEIKLEENNKYTDITIYNEDIVKKYFSEYLKNALYKPEVAYEMLDEEYKNKKFSNIEMFKQYVNNNKFNLSNSTIVKYAVNQFDGYVQYTLVDNYNNFYIIKEKSVMDFSIMLDNYTIESQEFDDKYENASDEVKIATNIDKIFKMINNKEYNVIYENYLNKEFKNKYFSDYQSFEEFMKNKFFDYNYLGKTSVENQANYYIVNINYKEGLSSAAEEKNTNIILKLNENTNFEFSFEI